jgi:hypothetical protein
MKKIKSKITDDQRIEIMINSESVILEDSEIGELINLLVALRQHTKCVRNGWIWSA